MIAVTCKRSSSAGVVQTISTVLKGTDESIIGCINKSVLKILPQCPLQARCTVILGRCLVLGQQPNRSLLLLAALALNASSVASSRDWECSG